MRICIETNPKCDISYFKLMKSDRLPPAKMHPFYLSRIHTCLLLCRIQQGSLSWLKWSAMEPTVKFIRWGFLLPFFHVSQPTHNQQTDELFKCLHFSGLLTLLHILETQLVVLRVKVQLLPVRLQKTHKHLEHLFRLWVGLTSLSQYQFAYIWVWRLCGLQEVFSYLGSYSWLCPNSGLLPQSGCFWTECFRFWNLLTSGVHGHFQCQMSGSKAKTA